MQGTYVYIVRGKLPLAEDDHACPTSSNLFVRIHYFTLVVLVFLLACRFAGGDGAPSSSSVRCCIIP